MYYCPLRRSYIYDDKIVTDTDIKNIQPLRVRMVPLTQVGDTLKRKMASKKDNTNSIFSATSILEKPLNLIPVSPNIDIMLGGGLVDGTFTLMSGQPKCGKTITALEAGASAQKIGKKVVYINAEGRIKARDIEGIQRLDLSEEKFQVVGHTKNKILDAHEFIEIVENLIRTESNLFIIFDSFSQLCPKDLRNHELNDRYRDYTPILLSNFTKRISGILPLNDNSLIGILHLISNQTPGSRKLYIESGGRKIQYAYDTKIVAKYHKPWVKNDDTPPHGQIVEWLCETSAIGMPNRKCTSYIRYGEGIDYTAEIIEMAQDLGIICKSRSWFSLYDNKVQGLDKLINTVKEDKKLYEKIYKDVYELLT